MKKLLIFLALFIISIYSFSQEYNFPQDSLISLSDTASIKGNQNKVWMILMLDQKPIFINEKKNAFEEFIKYIEKYLIISEEDIDINDSNYLKCYIELVIEKNGTLSNISFVKGLSNSNSFKQTKLQIINVIKNAPSWKKAGIKDGKPVRTFLMFPISLYK